MNSSSGFEKAYYDNEALWSGTASIREQNRIKTVTSHIPDDVKSILDAGCGNGIFINYLSEHHNRFDRIHGLDRSESALKFVKTGKTIGNIDNLPFHDREFDLVVCLEVLEHLPDTVFQKALKNLGRVANKYVMVSVPFEEDLVKHHTECPACHSRFHISLHLRSFKKQSMENLLLDEGFKCIKLLPMGESSYFHLITPVKRLITGICGKGKLTINHRLICPVCGLIIRKQESGAEKKPVEKKNSFFEKINKIFQCKTRYLFLLGIYMNNKSN
jgi:ubiquinone/menaquinone biosynthesis C-methylase UbiE/rubredoxin